MNQQKLKILHLVCSLNLGGAERLVIDLCNLQNNNDLVSSIFSLGNDKDDLVSEAKVLNIKVEYVSHKSRWGKYAALLKFVKDQKISVLQFHSPALVKFFLPIFWLLPKKTKIIYTRHGAAPFSSKSWKIVHQLAKPFVKLITFVSEDAQHIFLKHHNWPINKTQVIKNGINVPTTVRFKDNHNHILKIGSIGRMEPIKGQQYLLQAFAEMNKEQQGQFELHFFGHGSQFDKLNEFVKLQLSTMKVIFHGIVKDRELIYDEIDLQAVCSEVEGLSLAIMEAMARGIPSIATNVGGNPELIIHNQTGLLFDYGNSKQLANFLIQISQDRNLLNTLSKNAFQFIATDYSLESTARQYQNAYSNN